MNKTFRHGQILRLIHAGKIHTQEQLAHELASVGVATTQVTLSRDVRELGLVKTPEGYRQMGSGGGGESGTQFELLAGEFLQDVKSAQNLVVLKTAPGHANSVAVSLDN